MVNRLLGKKLGMTRIFLEEGKSIPVSVLQIGPCVVIQKKTRDKDGYDAIQIGYEPRRDSRVTRPLGGHFKAANGGCFAYLREIRVEEPESFELGQEINKGDPIGRTGQTGLAGGGHLHFGIMVNGTFVNPVEWWDAHWIQDSITRKLALVE